MKRALLSVVLVMLSASALVAQPGWDDLAGPRNDVPVMNAYDPAEFDMILRREQLIFTDRDRYHARPLRRLERHYPHYYRVVDSWFDVFWDTPAFRTYHSDGASLITFMFRDIVAFRPGGAPTPFSIVDFMNVGLRRWRGSREAYPVYGYWSLYDFSERNHDLVKKHMSNVAAFSFQQYFHAYARNDHSRAFTFQRIIHFIDYYKLPVICLLPGSNETVLIYKVVLRDDGQAAMFYYRPSDDAFYRRANEQYMRNVIFVRKEGGRVMFFNNARFQDRAFRFYSGVDDVLIIDDMAQVYAEVAPMLRMSGVVADITGKGDPIRGGMTVGSIIGALISPMDGTDKAATVTSLLLGQTPATLTPSQAAFVPPPPSQGLRWPSEYPYGVNPAYLPEGKGMTYEQYQQQGYGQVDRYMPGQYAGDLLFPGGKAPVPGDPGFPGGPLPPWVIQEKPAAFDFSAYVRVPWMDQSGKGWHDPRLPPRDHGLPPERFYPDKGGLPVDPGQGMPIPVDPGQGAPPPYQQDPGQWAPPPPPPYKPPVYLPPPPPLPPYVPPPPVVLPPKPPLPPMPPCPWPPKPPRPPRPPKPPKPPRPPRPPKPPKPPCPPPRPPKPPLPPKPPCPPPRPPKPPKPPCPWPAHCNAEYPNPSTKGHLFSGKKTGTGPGKFKLIGECYDDEYYNRFGYDEDGYDREGYDPWGEDRRGYDRKGYDPWGYDRRGQDPCGDRCHDTRLNKFRALYHRAPLRFRKKFAIGRRSGTIVRRRDRRVMWRGDCAIDVCRPFRGGKGDKGGHQGQTTGGGKRPYGNIDTSRPYHTNDKGQVIQYTPPGGGKGGRSASAGQSGVKAPVQTGQSAQAGQSGMFKPHVSDPGAKGQPVNVPLNARKHRRYHRK